MKNKKNHKHMDTTLQSLNNKIMFTQNLKRELLNFPTNENLDSETHGLGD